MIRTLFILLFASISSNLVGLYFSEYLQDIICGADGGIFGLLGS